MLGRMLAQCAWGFVMLLPIQVMAYSPLNEVWTFMSRPDLTPPRFEFSTLEESSLSPGYILFTPYSALPGSNLAAGSVINIGSITPAELGLIIQIMAEAPQNGPCVYDQKGNLIYSGYGSTGPTYAHNLKITEYNGSPHMTYYTGNEESGGGRGHGVISDQHYQTVQTVQSGLGRAPSDVHEFTVINGGKSALNTIYEPSRFVLSPYGLQQPYGWVVEGIFQEVDVESGEVLFEWRSLDHVETQPAMTYNTYGSNGTANGSSAANTWDYFHLNSVEKDSKGNYLISVRYLCALFYISGTDGSIIWQLNGRANKFSFHGFENNTFPFAFQHHARFHAQTDSTAIISIFDNGSDGVRNFHNSSGMIMKLDFEDMSCTLLHQFQIRGEGGTVVTATSQGSVQVLDNGDSFIGWGELPYVSEHTADGKLVMQGQFGAENAASSYRAFKANWTGTPDSTPALWAFSNTTASPTTFYTSWNGATEIASWKFYGGATEAGPFSVAGTAPKDGFETSFTADRYWAWGYIEALGAGGNVLGTTPVKPTYVPHLNGTVSNGRGANSTNAMPKY